MSLGPMVSGNRCLVGVVECGFCEWGAKGKTSYLAKTDQLLCTSEVEPVGQDAAGKT